MLIRLVPPPPHPTILYAVTFPNFLPLHELGPGATLPAAWSSQLQVLTSILQLNPPSSIHVLDRAVGLVARVYELSMDVPQKEFVVRFVDEREITVPMNSDCVQMLLNVVVDVKGLSELESPRSSVEGSMAGSTDDPPPGGGPTKPPKSGKHKRQRSLLFSLISSLVPKSFSLSSSSPSSRAPPPTPLPPLPVAGRVTSPSQQTSFASAQPNPEHLRRRARATIIDVWRRHVIPALAPQHLPAAGYAEWILVAMASEVRTELESVGTVKSRGYCVSNTKVVRSRHRRIQSESRNALDLGHRSDHCEPERWRCRPPSPFPDMLDAEETDQVVYPRREQADEWGVRYLHPRTPNEADVLAVEYNGPHDNLGEYFTTGDDWDSRLLDTAFDVSRYPLTPSDVRDDEESDDSQTSLRTPEDGEDLPSVLPAQILQGSAHHATRSAFQPSSVSRVGSSRPRSRIVSGQFSSAPSTSAQISHHPVPSRRPLSSACDFDYRDTQAEEFVASRSAYLERIYTALEVVRSRAREEGWRLFRATLIGANNEWMDAEAERSLEMKAKRRAWSSGIKIFVPYSTSRSTRKVWDGSFSTFRSSTMPPGLTPPSTGVPNVRGPIAPTGLSLGIPVRSSPLAMYAWGPGDEQKFAPSQYGILNTVHSAETIEGKRSSRVTFADSVTKLFPVCEDESEDLFESTQVDAVGFLQAMPSAVSAEPPECGSVERFSENEDDPFCFYPPRPRTRTTSMRVISPTPSVPSYPVLPMFRPSTPPPSYQTVVGEDASTVVNNEEGRLVASALLLQPLSPSSTPLSPRLPSRPPLTSNLPFVPRSRAVSLPTSRSSSSTNKTRRPSFNQRDEHVEDLSQAYASPPPEGPLVITATPAPHEPYPRYAHVHSPFSASKNSMNATILGRTAKEVVFEQAGSEFSVGLEVALGRAEEGRVVW